MATMPYGGGLGPRDPSYCDVESVLDFLAKLRTRLDTQAADHEQAVSDLRGLRSDLRAVGRVFGWLNEESRCVHENALGRCTSRARPGRVDCELHALDDE